MFRTIVALLALCVPAAAQTTRSVIDGGTVHVTGRIRSVNGVSDVPAGLFGVHASKLDDARVAELGIESVRYIDTGPSGKPIIPGQDRTPKGIKMVIECFYDRYQPALVLTSKDWKQRLETLARTYGEGAKNTGFTHHIEFWNEPFLNWATRPGVNYDPAFYEPEGREEGKPMTIRGQDKPTDFIVWSKELRLVDPKSGKVEYLPNGEPALQSAIRDGKLKEGGLFNWRGKKEYRLDRVWWGKDTSQKNYYSARQNSLYYRWMLVPFARALKESNPDVQLVAGWGFSIATGGWEAWDTLFRPTIDDSFVEFGGKKQLLLDGIGEHHYGGDTRGVAATYEVAYAYALGEYNKRLKFYNTEAGGMLDPQRPDTIKPTFSGGGAAEWRGMFSYFVRDITYMINRVPDKAIARAAHSIDGNPGDTMGFRFLKDLRGKLVQTIDPGAKVWSCASVNGTKLVAVVFNDNLEPARVRVDVSPPAGAKLKSALLRHVQIQSDGQQLELIEEPLTRELLIDPKMAALVVYELEGQPDLRPHANETQHVATGILHKVEPGKKLDLTIAIPADALKSAKSATLKLILDNFDPAAASITINGTPISFKQQGGVNVQTIDVTLLKTDNVLTFTCAPAAAKPMVVQAASIVTAD